MTDTTRLNDFARPVLAGEQAPESTAEGETQLVGFSLAEREFALKVENIIKIVRQVEVTDVPDAPGCVEGIVNVAGLAVPLLNMFRLLGIGDKSPDINTQIIVAYGASGIVGLMVDNVSDIVTVPSKNIVKPSRSATRLSEFVCGIVDRHGTLMLQLDVEKLVDHKRWGEVTKAARSTDSKTGHDAAALEEQEVLRQRAEELSRKDVDENSRKRRLVTFTLGDDVYGLDVTAIKEVSNAVDIYFIPSAPEQISGVINLRGIVVPVIDPESILGLQRPPGAAYSSIVVLEHDNLTVGLLTDKIGDIVEVAAGSIEVPLSTIDPGRAACLEGAVEWEGRLLGILNPGKMVRLNTKR